MIASRTAEDSGACVRSVAARAGASEIERHTVGVAADKLAQWRKMCDKLDQLAKTKGLAFVSSDVFALCVLCPHAHLFAVM